MTNYSFTVTLKPSMYRYEPEEQFDMLYRELFLIMKRLSNNFTLVTELTSNYNIHWHGIIELHHKKKWYSVFRKTDKFGFTCCREIYDMTEWKKYISKSLGETMANIGRPPILNDDYKVFDIAEQLCYKQFWD